MPQITNLRLLFASANHHITTTTTITSPFFLSPLKPKPHLSSSPSISLFFKPQKTPFLFSAALSSSYSNKPKNNNNNNNNKNNYNSFKRNKSSLREKGGLAMEETNINTNTNTNTNTNVNESVGCNRKRALGRDNSDKPKKTLQLKVRKLNPVNTISYVQILGTGMDTQDTSPSVLLFFDKQRFIFNAGEGLQRFCTEHKIKLSKIDHIFLSRVCSETAGGLPGLLLTLAAMGEEGMSVNIWGPSDLKYLIDAMKSFIPNAAMVHTRSFGPALNSNGVASTPSEKFDDPLVLIDDEVVKISAILLRPSSSAASVSMKEESSELGASKLYQDGTKDYLSGGLSPERSDLSSGFVTKTGDISVAYICELPEIKGKFDPKKAASLGLRPGPKYRELQLGNSVKSDRQDIMVHPSDVLGPSVPGPIVLLVDCPTLPHFEELLSKGFLADYYADTSGDQQESQKTVNCIIHLSPASVTNTTKYQNWMSRFGGAQHIMAGHEMRNVEVPILKSSARIAARLHYLCPQFFPSPGFWSLQQQNCLPSGSSASSMDSVTKSSESLSAENLLKFNLRPYAHLGLDKSAILSMTSSSEIIDELLSEIPEIVDASQRVAHFCSGQKEASGVKAPVLDKQIVVEEPWLPEPSLPICLEDVTREDMEIVLLGTGSSQPSKYRNVSSIFINLFSKGSILFDCGEGTLGQLKRRFGIDGADDAVRSLRCIWISHIHADHHTGLARILALRRDLLKGMPHEPLIVVGPRQLKRFLDAYQRLEDLDMQFLDCRHTTEAFLEAFVLNENTLAPGNPNTIENINGNKIGEADQNINSTLFAKGSRMQSYWKRPGSPVDNSVALPILKNLRRVLQESGLEALISFPVIHCPQAFGVVLTAASRINSAGKTIPGWKIVYSGDTRPCPELIEAARGATVLIHEATFEDGMIEEAISRNHSTTKEAIEVGDSAGVYRIILTHFSQRYPKIPVFDETHMHKTCIAFDLMSVNLADLPVLPRVLPYLKLLFRDEMIVDESDDLDIVNAVA